MIVTKHSALVAAAILRLISLSAAVPSPSPGAGGLLSKRSILSWEDCGDDNDPRRKKAGQAFADAAQLARWTFDKKLDDGTAFADTKAYSHYYEDSDKQIVTTMMDEVHLNNQPSTNPSTSYTFIVSCKETKDCADGTLAVSDSRPPSADFTPIIRLCPAFFDPNTPQTKNDLSSKEIKRDPGRRDSSWCQPDQPFSFFETAGHTIFHEMTHLDQLGQAAGLSPRDVAGQNYQSHGTDDIYAIDTGYDLTSPERSARKLKDNWTAYNKDNSQKKPPIQRVENAEGYAASATEFYFQQGCGWSEIML